jgi:antirestriction protein ArdC
MNTQSYERITERIVALLEQGTVPWHQPWRVTTGLPRNLVSQKPYRGINAFVLAVQRYDSPDWLTFRQAIQLGGSVRKGEKACPVVFWKQFAVEDEVEKPRKIPLLRLYHVFNAAQCDGLKAAPEAMPMEAAKPAEIVAGMPERPVIKHGMTQAFYAPVDDTVWLPPTERFDGIEQYYATLFHELIHSTGHEKRLKRASIMERNGYGTDAYCREELIAELGSAFLCGHAGIVDRMADNSAAYLASWLERLQNDKTLIVSAAAQAQKAADYILGHTFTEKRGGQ